MSETGVFHWVTGNIDTILSVLTLCVAAWATCVASRGLTTWKKQMVGELDKELAQKVWTALSDYRRALRLVPEPFITADDLKWLKAEETSLEASLCIKRKRYFQSRVLQEDLQRTVYQADAMWAGETEIAEQFRSIQDVSDKVFSTLRKLHRLHDSPLKDNGCEKRLELEAYFYGDTEEETALEETAFEIEMESAFQPLEETLVKKMRASG